MAGTLPNVTSLSLIVTATFDPFVPVAQAATLVALYDSTHGDTWTDNTGWQNADQTGFTYTSTACRWHGVSCSDTNLLAVSLPDNGLAGGLGRAPLIIGVCAGTLPGLSTLTGITNLLLQSNAISGAMPHWTGLA